MLPTQRPAVVIRAGAQGWAGCRLQQGQPGVVDKEPFRPPAQMQVGLWPLPQSQTLPHFHKAGAARPGGVHCQGGPGPHTPGGMAISLRGGSRHPATAELNLEQRREAILLVKARGQAVLPQPTSPLCLSRGEACCSHLASGSLLPGPVLGSLQMLPLIPKDTSP